MTAQDSYYQDDEQSYQPHSQGYLSRLQPYPPQPQGYYQYTAQSPQPQQYGSYNSHPPPAPYAYGAYPPAQYHAEQQHAYGTYPQNVPPPATSYGNEPQYNQYPPQPQSYNHAPALDPYGHPAQPPFGAGNEAGRGVLGALAGGAAGGYGGHQVGHGVIGTIGGAVAGSMLEDHFKDKKKKKQKHGMFGRRDSSSSSSSSSDDEKKNKKYGRQHGQSALLGNFSASCNTITLDGDYDLIASCATVSGHHKLSSIKLDDCFANIDGRLVWAKNGHFVASSRDIRLLDNGRVLQAACGDGRGWIMNHIRLDERITNDDGELRLLD